MAVWKINEGWQFVSDTKFIFRGETVMKNCVLVLSLVAVTLFVFTACNRSIDIITPPIEAEEVVEEIPIKDVDETTLPHPFATALREYMEGYDGVVRAYLTTLDDDGTMGVLTSKTPILEFSEYWEEYIYRHPGTLFYMQDGGLVQVDTEGLFVSGRYNRLMRRFYTHTFMVEIVYKLESGRLEISTQLEYFSDDYLSMLFDDDGVIAERIAERDARAEYAREKYGFVAVLPSYLGHMPNTQDQTAQILAMTINCVPSLAH